MFFIYSKAAIKQLFVHKVLKIFFIAFNTLNKNKKKTPLIELRHKDERINHNRKKIRLGC